MKILIMGATGEVGSVLQTHLANEGHELILVARNSAKLSSLCRSISKQGAVKHQIIEIDFDNSESLIDRLKNQEDINGVVVNPPRIPSSNELFPGEAEWLQIFGRVFLNPLELLRQCIDHMPEDKLSKIVVISGISSI